jgi:hypothetical protein
MMKRWYLCFAVLAIITSSCAKKSDEASSVITLKGDRRLGVHQTEAQGQDFATTFQQVLADGFDHINMHQIWGSGGISSLPVTPLASNAAGTTFDFTTIDIANIYYPNYSTPVMLTVGTIDTNNKFVPTSFVSTAFSDSTLRAAFKTMLGQLLTHLSATTLVSLQIGNEVDVYLGTNASAWAEYKVFFDDVVAYAKTLRPDLKLGVTVTLDGALDSSKASYIQSLTQSADIFVVTYYPMNSDFTMKSPSHISEDLGNLVATYGSKPIYFQEVGYSSGSTYVTSSENQQKEFVTEFFRVWDLYASQIPVVSWLNYTEWSSSTVDGFGTQYGMCPGVYCNSFKEYLRTLGLRNYSDGSSKASYTELKLQLQQRAW